MSLLGAIVGAFVCARDCAKAKRVGEVGNVFTDAKEKTKLQVAARFCAKQSCNFAQNGPNHVPYCARKAAAVSQTSTPLYGPAALRECQVYCDIDLPQ